MGWEGRVSCLGLHGRSRDAIGELGERTKHEYMYLLSLLWSLLEMSNWEEDCSDGRL